MKHLFAARLFCQFITYAIYLPFSCSSLLLFIQKVFKKEVTFQRTNFRNMKVSLENTTISVPSHRDPA